MFDRRAGSETVAQQLFVIDDVIDDDFVRQIEGKLTRTDSCTG
jgi:hypothetical protein